MRLPPVHCRASLAASSFSCGSEAGHEGAPLQGDVGVGMLGPHLGQGSSSAMYFSARRCTFHGSSPGRVR